MGREIFHKVNILIPPIWCYKQKDIKKFSPLLQIFSFACAIGKVIKRQGRDIA